MNETSRRDPQETSSSKIERTKCLARSGKKQTLLQLPLALDRVLYVRRQETRRGEIRETRRKLICRVSKENKIAGTDGSNIGAASAEGRYIRLSLHVRVYNPLIKANETNRNPRAHASNVLPGDNTVLLGISLFRFVLCGEGRPKTDLRQ